MIWRNHNENPRQKRNIINMSYMGDMGLSLFVGCAAASKAVNDVHISIEIHEALIPTTVGAGHTSDVGQWSSRNSNGEGYIDVKYRSYPRSRIVAWLATARDRRDIPHRLGPERSLGSEEDVLRAPG